MNVNTAQVAQAKLEALIEAAKRSLDGLDYGAQTLDAMGQTMKADYLKADARDLRAAIAEARK